MGISTPQRFAFTIDGHATEGPAAEMTVTYVGRISRSQALADAQRRFEEWRRLPNPLSKRWSSHQVVVR